MMEWVRRGGGACAVAMIIMTMSAAVAAQQRTVEPQRPNFRITWPKPDAVRGIAAPKTIPTVDPPRRVGSQSSGSPAFAWEVEAHAGGSLASLSTAGVGIGAFPAGESFVFGGAPSRYESSWMFGDGALLINQIAPTFSVPIVTARMTPLDSMLTTASLERSQTFSVGAHVSRGFATRLRVAFSVEAVQTSTAFTQASVDRMEATRASFVTLWNQLLLTGGSLFHSSTVIAAVDGADRVTSWQTSLTGGVEYDLLSRSKFAVYAAAGGGAVLATTTLPEATLTGSYQFMYQPSFPFGGSMPLSEQDRVRVHYTMAVVPIVAFGGGARFFFTNRSGVRLDVRLHVSPNSLETMVDAHPSFVEGSPAFSTSSHLNPNLVFSNSPAVRGNLTGPQVDDLKTFSGSGMDLRTAITVGYFFRF